MDNSKKQINLILHLINDSNNHLDEIDVYNILLNYIDEFIEENKEGKMYTIYDVGNDVEITLQQDTFSMDDLENIKKQIDEKVKQISIDKSNIDDSIANIPKDDIINLGSLINPYMYENILASMTDYVVTKSKDWSHKFQDYYSSTYIEIRDEMDASISFKINMDVYEKNPFEKINTLFKYSKWINKIEQENKKLQKIK